MTIEEFLAWSEAQPKEAGRFELWDGQVVEKHGAAGEMNAERSQHWEMKASLYRAIHAAIKSAQIEAHVAIDGASVQLLSGRLVEPDVLVYLGPKVPRGSLIVPNPVVVCEVLSPATAKFDLSTKLDGYFSIASVQHYIVADPDKPLLIHHAREAGKVLRTQIVNDRRSKLARRSRTRSLTWTKCSKVDAGTHRALA